MFTGMPRPRTGGRTVGLLNQNVMGASFEQTDVPDWHTL